MRVVVANKFWYVRGGLERVMFDEIDALTAAGHEVVHFSMRHPMNEPSPWERFFAPYLELGGEGLSAGKKARAATRLFRNRPAARAFDALLAESRPDLVHVHGIHRQLSPSILFAARRRGIPVVHTLHDYHLLCPADVMLRGGETPCDPPACGKYRFGPALSNRCTKGSRAMTGLACAELGYQRVTRAYERGVTRFIAPSAYLAGHMLAAGWTVPVDVVPQGVRPGPGGERGGRFLFAGRLGREKGVGVLLEAARRAGVPVIVAGDGPEGPSLRAAYPDAEFLGHVPAERLAGLVATARAAVVPSVCLENAPMAVLEPLAAGVPVIASAVGGIAELLRDGVDGVLVAPGDADALSTALRLLAEDDSLARRMGEAARAHAAERFGMDAHTDALLAVYRRALGEDVG